MRNKLKLAKIYSEKAKTITSTVSTTANDIDHAQVLLRRARRIIAGATEQDTVIIKKIKRNVCQAYSAIIKKNCG